MIDDSRLIFKIMPLKSVVTDHKYVYGVINGTFVVRGQNLIN